MDIDKLTDEVNKGCGDTSNGCHACITETEPESEQQEERTSNDSDSDSFPQDIKDTIATLRVVIDRINSDLKQARDLILEIARLLDERRLCERGYISIKIKEILEDKIKAGKVTERWIRKCLPQEYKRKYTKDKRELSSLSKQDKDKDTEEDQASSANDTVYNRFDNSELSEEEKERESHRKCKNYEILQQKYEQLQSKLQGYEEVVRTHTSVKTAKELIYRSSDGYQQFEFSVSFESLRQHMIAAFNSNSSVNRVWFTGKFNHRTGEVVDVRIGKTIDTDTLEIKQESKTAVILKDDTLDDITGD